MAAGSRVRRRRLAQSRFRAFRLVADRGAGACGAVRAHPRPAAAPRRLARARHSAPGCSAFGTYWLYTCLHVFGLVPIWLTVDLAGGSDRVDVGLFRARCAISPIDFGSSPARRAPGWCCRCYGFWLEWLRGWALERIPVAVAWLCDDRFAAAGLGAAVRRLWRDVGRRHDRRRAQCAADAGRLDAAARGRAGRCCRFCSSFRRFSRSHAWTRSRRAARLRLPPCRAPCRRTKNGRRRISMRPWRDTRRSRHRRGERG